jgi:tetratricopeptide (TPR) repeat protein
MIGLALTSPRVRQLAMKKQLRPVAAAVAAPAPAPVQAVVAPVETAAPVEAAPAPEPVAPAEASALSGCHDEFERRQWKAALATCTLAFEAAPDAALALKVAHAHWSRGETYRAGKWAKKAVEMGTDNADAYVLIGHAERRAGKGPEALAAYRRYLKEAPYGWHAVRVRAAIRAIKAEPGAEN